MLTQRDPKDLSDPDYVAPSSELERALAAIWSRALGIADVGVRSNFFDLGGGSLTLDRITADLSEMLDARISSVVVFQYPTVEGLARYVQEIQIDSQRGSECDNADKDAVSASQPGRGRRFDRVNDRTLEERARRKQIALARQKRIGN